MESILNNTIRKIVSLKDYPIICVFAAIFIICFFRQTTLFSQYEIVPILSAKVLSILRYFCIFLFLVYFCLYKVERKYLYFFIVFIISDYVLKKLSNTHILFELFFLPLCLSKFVRRDKLFKVLFFASFIAFVSVILMNYVGILQSADFFRDCKTRFALGFVHPNSLGLLLIYTAFLYSLSTEKYSPIFIVTLVFIAIFNWFIPRSVTSALIILFYAFSLVILYFFKIDIFFNKNKKLLFYIIVSSLIFMILLIYYVSYTETGKEFLLKMPGAIWARFEFGMMAYERYGISFWGTPIEETIPDATRNITEFFIVDCSYFFIPINYGIVTYLLYIAAIIFILYKTIFNGEYRYLAVLILFLFYGISENLLTTLLIMPVYAFIFCARGFSEKNMQTRMKI